VAVRPDRIDIYFDTVKVVRQGVGLGSAQEKLAGRVLQKKKFVVTVDLHQGSSSAEVYTSDLSFDYVKINAEYRS
jgi:glutamate N-acetyltransferase/amino-acid N-acetyltransferase